MRISLFLFIFSSAFAQDSDPQKTVESLEKINTPKIPEYCENCTAKKTESPPDQPSDPVPYTCELSYQNDNYLYGLKDITDWKDGNDYGKTFELGFLSTYRWKNKEASLKYEKVLFANPVLSITGRPQAYQGGGSKPTYMSRKVDVDRVQLSLRHKMLSSLKQGEAFFVEGTIGFEDRKRVSGTGSKIQQFWHEVIDAPKFEYYGPEAISDHIPAEKLKEPIPEKAVLWGGAAGLNKVYFKGKCTVDAKAGALVASDAHRFISQNSNAYLTGKVKGSFGKKTKYEPILAQSLLVYAKSQGDSRPVGASTDMGVQVKISAKKTQYEPFLLMSVPMGRQEFPEFNDRDKLMTMGLRVKFLGATPK